MRALPPQPMPIIDPKSKGVLPHALKSVLAFCESKEIQPSIAVAICDSLTRRAEEGIKKYGVPLMTFNGRNALQDATEEGLDMIMYLTQARHEQSSDSGPIPSTEIVDIAIDLVARLLVKLDTGERHAGS